MVEMDEIEMSVEEQDTLCEFKKLLLSEVNKKIYNDTYMLYRFLSACNFNIENAEIMLKKMLHWRRQMKIDSILIDYEPLEVFKKYVGETQFAHDKNGAPVHYFPFGKYDVKGVLSSCKYVDLEKFCVHILEKNEKYLEKKRKSEGGPIPGLVFIVDTEGLDFATATDKKGIESIIRFLKLYQSNYPDRIGALYVINVSSFFYIAYSMIKNFLEPSLIKRIHIYGLDGWTEELLKVIDADVLPEFLGGSRKDPDGNPLCKTIVCQGGKVDDKYYLPKSKKELSSHPDAKKLVLSRASFLEIEVEVGEGGSLIEWEFETKTRDIGFGLFHKEMVKDEEKITELVPLLRMDTESYAETGMYKCELAGTYVILFDNSYSWIRSKEIYYRIKVISPQEHEKLMK